jgi:hypothetical protein
MRPSLRYLSVFETRVARAHHKVIETQHRLRPSLADRFYIAMLFSDAPMQI